MHFDEIELMEKIQKLNFSKQMKLISTPFNTMFFIVMIIVLFVYKVLDFSDLKLVIIGCVINSALKFLFKRARPYHASDKIKNYSDKEHKVGSDHYSFPSGHTFAATFFSLVMLHKYPNEFIFNIKPCSMMLIS